MAGVINDSRSDVLPSPTSYAVQKPQPILVDAPAASQAARDGVRPSQIVANRAADNIPQAMAAASEMSERTRASLAALSPMIAKKLNRIEQENFADGYLRHLQGESVAAIADDDPFSVIFGDGAAVRGARARQAESSGLAMMAWVEENKGDLSRMSLDEQRGAISTFLESMSTGDQQADMLITQGAMKAMPGIMDNLARSHIEEQQKQAAIAQAETIKQGADSMKYAGQEVAYGRMSQEKYAEIQAQYLEAIRPLPGQTTESYRQAMTGNYMMLLKDGQFDMAATILDNVVQPLMTPEEELQLYVQGKQAQSLWLMDNPLAQDYTLFTETLPSQIMAGRFSSVDGVLKSIDDMNAKYMQETGNVYPLIDNKARGGFADMFTKNQIREAERAQDKAFQMALKQQEAQTKLSMYYAGYANGDPALMGAAGLDGPQKYAVDAQVAEDFYTNPTGGAANTLSDLAINGFVNPIVKQRSQRTLEILANGGIPSGEDLQLLNIMTEKFSNTPYAEASLAAYSGDYYDIVKEMQGLDMSVPSNVQYIKDRAQTRKVKLQATPELKEKANTAISDIAPGWLSTTFGRGRELGAGTEMRMKQTLGDELMVVLAQNPNLTEDKAVEVAGARMMSKNSMVGNYLIEGDRSKKLFKTLNTNLDVPMQNPQDVRLNVMVDKEVRQYYPKGNYEIGSISVVNDNGNDLIIGVNMNGTTKYIPTSAARMATTYNEFEKAKEADRMATRKFMKTTTSNIIRQDQFDIRGR